MFTFNESDQAILTELGARLAAYRLNRNMTQAALAQEAGVSTPTVQRIEAGHSTQTTNLIRILRALDLVGNLDALIPAPPASPIQQAQLKGRIRKRASGTLPDKATSETWIWEDEE